MNLNFLSNAQPTPACRTTITNLEILMSFNGIKRQRERQQQRQGKTQKKSEQIKKRDSIATN